MKARPILTGLLFAGIGAVCFSLYAHRYEVEVSGGEGVEVLASVARIERGAVISGDGLAVRTFPQAYVDERYIPASAREKILGLRAAEPIGVSQPLMWGDVIATREDKRDLSSLVEPGRRAVTAPFTALSTFAMIRPGDFVDVIATVTQDGSDRRASSVLLQRVMVLAIGNRTVTDRPDEARRGPSQQQPILTLSLNLQEAQALSLASQHGSLSVALRNPNDQRISNTTVAVDTSPGREGQAGPLGSLRDGRRPIGQDRGPTRLEDAKP